MQRTLINTITEHKGDEVLLQCWVNNYRDQGKMVFFDFRDHSGIVQAVVLPGHAQMELAKSVRNEWVVSVRGRVNERPEKNRKQGTQNGDVELEVLEITILNESESPVFDVSANTADVDEETRLKHRFLDLRSTRMQNNLRARSRMLQLIRSHLVSNDFVEIETPLLTKSTPEGARDYVVPSRVFPGNYYALPQSPQQYKQLLMTGGMNRYFQVARCLRDEDSRGDRQPEFTQIDMEMSFVEMNDVMQMNEDILIDIVSKMYPEKTIQSIPFPRIPYSEAMATYGNDRPDIRNNKNDPNLLAFCWVTDFPFFESTKTSDDPQAVGEWTFTHNPFSAPIPEHMHMLMNKQNIADIITSQYDITLNGYEIGGGSIRNHSADALHTVFEILGHSSEKIQEQFGHMLRAFKNGTPPHGGIAWGFDRLVMLLQGEPNIREVIAFPKTRSGQDVMMNAPSQISDKQKTELKIRNL